MKTILANRQNYGGKRSVVKYIVIHYTGNDGDTAENNAKYFKNNVTKTSAHYFVDDTEAILSVPEDYVAYSVGGKGNGPLKNICTNKNSISIELCDTVRNGTIAPTDKTVENALQLTRDLMSKYGIPKSNVVRHWDVTTKNCLPVEETELLTPNGWKYLRDIRKGEMVCSYYTDSDTLRFSEVQDVVKQHIDTVYENHHVMATADHRMWAMPSAPHSHQFREVPWGYILDGKKLYIIKNGAQIDAEGLPLSDNEIRFLVWIQGDGHYMWDKGKCVGIEFHLKKKRKIERLHKLLQDLKIDYRDSYCSDGSVHIRLYDKGMVDWAEKWLDEKRFDYNLLFFTQKQYEIFREELVHVDGNRSKGQEVYTSVLPQNLDVVQAIAAVHGERTVQTTLGADYRSAVSFGTSNYTVGNNARQNTNKHKAIVSCVTVESGYILIRQNRRTFIVGNCPAYWVNDDRWKTEFWDKIDHPQKPIEFVPIVPEDRAVYRLYNPYSGEHFFTANPAEGDSLQALGWSYEGIAWKWAEGADLPVYRLYNSYTGEHFFTANAYEKNILTIHGWNDEGEAFPSGGSTPVYRLYNEFHHYTSSLAERDKLVADGWKDEGVAWNCEKNDHERNVIRRMISDRSNHRM